MSRVVFTVKRPTSEAPFTGLPCRKPFTLLMGTRRFWKKFEMQRSS